MNVNPLVKENLVNQRRDGQRLGNDVRNSKLEADDDNDAYPIFNIT